MITVVKNLVLLKQLYLSSFSQEFREDISCIGHFDAIKITDARDIEDKNELYLSKGSKNLSNLWKMISEVDKNLSGKYSVMSIGLFKNIKTKEEEEKEKNFWSDINTIKEYNSNKKSYNKKKSGKIHYPFYCICLLKSIEFNMDILNTIKNDIDKLDTLFNGDINLIIYNTYDHADLVVIIKSRGLLEIRKAVYLIECHKYVLYVDTILGAIISPQDKNNNYIFEPDFNNKNDNIGYLCLHVSSGKDDSTSDLFKNLKTKDNRRFYSLGVNNNEFRISRLGNSTFYDTLATNLEHNQYKIPIYTVESNINFYENKIKEFKNVVSNFYNKENDNVAEEKINRFLEISSGNNNWCFNTIKLINKIIKNPEIQNNDAKYTRYIAFLKIINALSQYESNILGAELFELILPVVSYYSKEFLQENSYLDNLDYIMKDNIANLFVTLDHTLSRIIHTEHRFMMIPGYNGMLFDIPIKLCLMYLSFMYKAAKVLSFNDCNNKKKNNMKTEYPYRILFVPSMEQSPSTSIDEKEKYKLDKVIFINIPQKHLYQPRSLCIILAHELAHYVGNSLRNRNYRMQCAAEIILNLLYNEIFISYENSNIYKSTYIADAVDKIMDFVSNYRKAYESQFGLTDEEIICTAFKYYLSNFSNIYNKNNNISLWACNIPNIDHKINYYMDFIERNIVKIYDHFREVLSDFCAIQLLKCDILEYIEAFRISEGHKLSLKNKPDLDRLALVINTLLTLCPNHNYKKSWKDLCSSDSKYLNGFENIDDIKETIKDIKDYIHDRENITPNYNELNSHNNIDKLFSYISTWKVEKKYAARCYKSVSKTINDYIAAHKNSDDDEYQKILNLWQCFKVHDKENDNYDKKLEMVSIFISDYKKIADSIKTEDLNNLAKLNK